MIDVGFAIADVLIEGLVIMDPALMRLRSKFPLGHEELLLRSPSQFGGCLMHVNMFFVTPVEKNYDRCCL